MTTTMTLKVAHTITTAPADPGHPAGCFDVVSWKAGVSSVQRLDQGFYRTISDAYEKHGDGIAIYAELSVGSPAEPKPLTLLSVYYGEPGDAARSNWEIMLVERAWLLSSTGDTLERIAP